MRTDFYEENSPHGGIQRVWKFKNGYGASVVRNSFSYGHESGKWELAVIIWKGDRFKLTYDTPITDDVLGYLTQDDVDEILGRIENLPEVSHE
jgi:hypothetical protein